MAAPATSGSSSLLIAPPKAEDRQEHVDEDVKEFDDLIARSLASALRGSADLANMLPTGTLLLFQTLDPILRRAGSCQDKTLSAAFLIVCSVVCFVLSFTDSFEAPNGKVYYGFATFRGMWTPQIEQPCPGVDLSKFRITVGDFVHAFLTVYVFLTTSAFSTDVASCFFTVPDEVVRAAPSITAFLVSSVFLLFPTTRHGIGFPVKPPKTTASSKA
ncbi:protein DMP4 [Selaginella moellendorffii]|nr:protein DMP4 [Selaginella moellendorffii]|eukprot:XP_002966215.2 protein DMP4 [Selaginella moellendorffii]